MAHSGEAAEGAQGAAVARAQSQEEKEEVVVKVGMVGDAQIGQCVVHASVDARRMLLCECTAYDCVYDR